MKSRVYKFVILTAIGGLSVGSCSGDQFSGSGQRTSSDSSQRDPRDVGYQSEEYPSSVNTYPQTGPAVTGPGGGLDPSSPAGSGDIDVPVSGNDGASGGVSGEEGGGDGIITSELRLGLNFEDGGASNGSPDADFNDSVLCFSGQISFDPESRRIFSQIDQEIVLDYTRIANCPNRVEVTITHFKRSADDTEPVPSPEVFNISSSSYQVPVQLRTNSEVSATITVGSGCIQSGARFAHTNRDMADVVVDVCNTSGQ